MKTAAMIEVLEARIAPAAAVFALSSLNGSNGFKLSGVGAGDGAGYSVSGTGDVNGDGFDDVLVGAPGADLNGDGSGASYLVFGKAGGFASVLNLAALDGTNGFKISGEAPGDSSGFSVSGAGDVNRDGFEDLLIGARDATANGRNSDASYVVFGKANGFAAALDLSTLNGTDGFKLSGAGGELAGRSVSGAGDVNGDGFDDLLIGAYRAGPPGTPGGAAYVVFGKAAGFAPALNLAALDGSDGFKISPAVQGNEFGKSVSGAGDINNDGFDDLLIGDPTADPNGTSSGASYVIFGKAAGFSAVMNVSALDGSNGFKINGVAAFDYAGAVVSGAGDINGDGFADLLISAYRAAGGTSYLVFGKASGWSATFNLSALNGANGFKLSGVGGDRAGQSLSGAGDVNADGFDDLLIGAPAADSNQFGDTGASYVVFGKAAGFSTPLNLSTLNGSNGFTVRGSGDGERSGSAVSGAGDVNGDGFEDLLIGAAGADPSGRLNAGASYVVFGRGVEINVSDAAVEEGDNGTQALQFTVSLTEAGTVPVRVELFTTDGTAQVGSDYAPLEQSVLTFAPGETSKTVTVSVLGDTTFESDETLSLRLGDAEGGVIRKDTGAGTIRNNDAPPIVSIAGASAVEGGAGTASLVFTVSLSAGSGLPVTVSFASADGAALAGNDYTALAPGALTFAPGETTKTIAVAVSGDTSIEDHESFLVTLSDASGATIGTGTASGTILNDDTALRITGPGDTLEGDSGTVPFVFTLNLEKASALPVTVNYASADGTATAGSDFTAPSDGAQISFAPGETSKTIAVEVLGDTAIEDHETFAIALSGQTNATIANDTATATILNEDTALHIDDVSAREGDSGRSPLIVTVSLEKPSALPVTVNYETIAGTASAGSDYESVLPGQLTFSAGETSKTITVEVPGDTSIEDHEAFTIALSGASNATIANGTASATILNDDTALHIAGVTAREEDSGMTPFDFTVSLEKPSALPVTVSYETADGTATAGSDYEAVAPTQLTFAAGETTKTISVDVLGDPEVEAHESFSVLLSGASGALIAEGTGTGTILNDETLVRITDASLLEGHSGTRVMTFTVSLSAETALAVNVDFASADGTATGGTDYTALAPGTLEFAPGETTKTLTVEVLGDTAAEGSETFSILLANATAAVIEDGTGVGTIFDDDVTLVGSRKATFTDADGELVTIKVSKGALKVEDFTIVPSGLGAQLALVDFSGETEFAGTKLSISAKAPPSIAGDGLAHVGYIDASGIDLGKVKVKGDLGQIDAGDGLDAKPGLKSLSAQSMGASGLLTQLPGGSLQSDLAGALGALKLKDGMHDATLSVSGDLGAVKITGDVRGSAIRSDGKIGAIHIGGDLAASAEGISTISARGLLAPPSESKALAIGAITIGGSVERAQLLAGYDRSGAAVNGDAGIGSVFIGANWSASSLAAGASAGADGMFGTNDDAPISPSGSIVAKIASITIKGTATGSADEGDHFGFVAEEISALKASGVKLSFTPGAGNDLAGLPVGPTGDLRVREVA